MTHIRRQIRDAVLTAVQATATAGSFAQVGRPKAIDTSENPAILISMGDEVIGASAMGGRRERLLAIHITVLLQGDATIDDDLDQIIAEVEAALGADRTLGGKCRACTLSQIAHDLTSQFSARGGAVQMTYLASYATTEGNAEAQI